MLIESEKAREFYAEILKQLKASGIPFMVGGTFAVSAYTGIDRVTKDLDIFCKAGDYPKILRAFAELGYKTHVIDERWLARVSKGKFFFDIVFNAGNALMPVTDAWFKESQTSSIFDNEVRLLPPTELLFAKAFIQERMKYDGPDVAHLILKKHTDIDWKRLLSYMDQYWEVLLVHMLNFRFIYPSKREVIPKWLLDELISRLEHQAKLPTPEVKICRGRILSRIDYAVDVKDWGFADVVGSENEIYEQKK